MTIRAQDAVKRLLPIRTKIYLQRLRRNWTEYQRRKPLTEDALREIVVGALGVKPGSVVFVHSSVDQLRLNAPPLRILALLRDVVGPEGTLLFPTFPKLSSSDTLASGSIFDVRKCISYTGLLTEFARRQPDAWRSLHPTKSVCAIGKYARELTATHQASPRPYDSCSPYYKIMQYNGMIIGLGVSTKFITFIHCIDDYLKEEFPVRPYHPTIFETQCINYEGQVEIVSSYAHDSSKQGGKDIPRLFKRYVPPDIAKNMIIRGREFYRADARRLFVHMTHLARQGITIYPRSAYEKEATR